MSMARTFGFVLFGTLLGAACGGVLGLGGGLAYTELAATSGAEGYSGYVVVYWILAGILLGLVAGGVAGAKWPRR